MNISERLIIHSSHIKDDACYSLNMQLMRDAAITIDNLTIWQNEAAAVMARFINLSDHPDRNAWGETAIEATRLLNMPNDKLRGA